jgi:hypothetical protein
MANIETGFIDVTLNRAIDVDGTPMKVLRVREPTVADQLLADEYKGSDSAKELITMANLCQVSIDDLKKLTLKDYKKLQEAFINFIT